MVTDGMNLPQAKGSHLTFWDETIVGTVLEVVVFTT